MEEHQVVRFPRDKKGNKDPRISTNQAFIIHVNVRFDVF